MSGLFYVDSLTDVGTVLTVSGEEGRHAATVRRIRPGEELTLSDGAGGMAGCVVQEAGRDGLVARVVSRWTVAPSKPSVTVAQALPKADRSELAVELATEAGADGFVAWQAERCVARWDGARADKGLRRWRAVVRAAAGQSRRAHIPPVDGPLSTPALCGRVHAAVNAGATVLALHESATESLIGVNFSETEAVLLIIGPEGGIAPDEITELVKAGAAPVRLGPTVLRTSTAAAVALGALGVLTPRWD